MADKAEEGLIYRTTTEPYKPPHKKWPKCFTITIIVTIVTASMLLGIWFTVSEFERLKSVQQQTKMELAVLKEKQVVKDKQMKNLQTSIEKLQKGPDKHHSSRQAGRRGHTGIVHTIHVQPPPPQGHQHNKQTIDAPIIHRVFTNRSPSNSRDHRTSNTDLDD